MADRGSFRATHAVLLDTPKFKAMSSNARYTFHVLKLTRLNNLAGIFILDAGAKLTVSEQTGIPTKKLSIAIRELIDNQYVIFEDPVLWIRNQVKHDPYVNIRNEKHRTAIGKVLNGLPPLAIIAKFCNYYKLTIPIHIPIEYQSNTIGSVIRYTDPDPDPDSEQDKDPDTEDSTESNTPENGRIASQKKPIEPEEEIRREYLTQIIVYLNPEHIPYMPKDEASQYKLAGWLVKKCLGRPEVALEFMHQKCVYLRDLADLTAFRKVVTTICQNPETMGNIESAAHKEL